MIKLFTHNDFDGVICYVLANLAYGDNVDVSFCPHIKINSLVETCFKKRNFDEVHITDIAVNPALALKIEESMKPYMLLDHHQTSLPLNQFSWCKVEVNDADGKPTCGAKLYYDWLVENDKLQKSDVLDEMVELTRNYDTWMWAELGEYGLISKDINDLLYLYDRPKFIQWALNSVKSGKFPNFSSVDRAVLDVNTARILAYVDEKEEDMEVAQYHGYNMGLIFADSYTNDIAHILCARHPELDYMAIVNASSCRVSLRSEKDNVDVSEIAKIFNGGGHRQAAGFSFTKHTKQKMFGDVFVSLIFERG